MAAKFWKIALGVGCGVVLLAVVVVALLFLGSGWLVGEMERRGAEPLTAMEISQCEPAREGGSVTVRGAVLNGGESAVGSVKLGLEWTDASGSVIAEDSVYTAAAPELAPGETSTFEHAREDPDGAIAGVTCRIACVSTPQALLCSGP